MDGRRYSIQIAKVSADCWPDHVRLSDLEPLFSCQACGIKGAHIKLDFSWNCWRILTPA
jgi:hypothetical protein